MFLAMSQVAAHHQACQELLAKVWLAGGSEMFMVQLSKQGSIHVNMVYIGISTRRRVHNVFKVLLDTQS